MWVVTVCQTAVSVILPLGLATNSHNVLDTVALVPQVVPPSLPPFLALQDKAFFFLNLHLVKHFFLRSNHSAVNQKCLLPKERVNISY